MLLQVLLWSAIVALYVGIASAVGVFSRQAIHAERGLRLLAAVYSLALFLPATVLVLMMVDPPFHIALFVIAAAVMLFAYRQPSWIPRFVWQRTFTYHYLASVMALAALWGIAQAQEGSSAAPLLITISAVAAAAASSGATLKTPSLDTKPPSSSRR